MSDEAVYRTAPATPGLLNIDGKNGVEKWCARLGGKLAKQFC